jgi:hypothetical protein
MSRAFITEEYLTDIANAIRTVEGGGYNKVYSKTNGGRDKKYKSSTA